MVPSIHAARGASFRAATRLLLLIGAASLAGCHVVTDQELAAIRAQGQHHGPDPEKIFTEQVMPYADKNAKPAAQVIGALTRNFDDACKQYGFRQSSAFPCNFWIRVQGTVSRIDTTSRVGKAVVEVAPASGGGEPVQVALETGPVLIGTGVRDGFPGVKYGDFDDQTRFAAFGQAINKLVVARAEQSKLKVGERVDVAAVYSSWSEPAGEIRAIPVAWK